MLLTRPPLTRRFVRLACLIHSASVCPEPGSNSPKKRFHRSVERVSPLLTGSQRSLFVRYPVVKVRRPLSRPEREDYRLLAPVSTGSGPKAFAVAAPRGASVRRGSFSIAPGDIPVQPQITGPSGHRKRARRVRFPIRSRPFGRRVHRHRRRNLLENRGLPPLVSKAAREDSCRAPGGHRREVRSGWPASCRRR